MAVACSKRSESEAGYATAAAAVVAMVIAVGAIAVSVAAQQELANARRSVERARAEAELDGAQLLAVASVIADGRDLRYRWTIAGEKGPIELLAESERVKLSIQAAAELDDDTLARLTETPPESLRARLRATAVGDRVVLSQLDGAPLWRRCASSLLSRYGRGGHLALQAASAPASLRTSWRAGEEWRLRATSDDGWTDERIVRFTGDPRRPAGVVSRRLLRDAGKGEPCAAFISDGVAP